MTLFLMLVVFLILRSTDCAAQALSSSLSSDTGTGTGAFMGVDTSTEAHAPSSCPTVDSHYGDVLCSLDCTQDGGFAATFISPDSRVARPGVIQTAAIHWSLQIPTGPVMLSRFTVNPLNETEFKLIDQVNITVLSNFGIQYYSLSNPMFVDQGDFVGVTLLAPDFLQYHIVAPPSPANRPSMLSVRGKVIKNQVKDRYIPFHASHDMEALFQFTVTEHLPCNESSTGSGSGSGSSTDSSTSTATSSSTSSTATPSSSSTSTLPVIISSTASSSSSSTDTFTLTTVIGGVAAAVGLLLIILGMWYCMKKRSGRRARGSINESLLATQP